MTMSPTPPVPFANDKIETAEKSRCLIVIKAVSSFAPPAVVFQGAWKQPNVHC